MTERKLRQLYDSGLTYDEIAEANFRSEGWKPTRPAVKRKLVDEMGLPPRRGANQRDLLPWSRAPGHDASILRHMLGAESRRRALKRGEGLSDTDRVLVDRLQELLFGRGTPMVIGYDRHVGFYAAPREDEKDVIRRDHERRFPDPVEQAIWDLTELDEAERYTLIAVIRDHRSQEVPAGARTG